MKPNHIGYRPPISLAAMCPHCRRKMNAQRQLRDGKNVIVMLAHYAPMSLEQCPGVGMVAGETPPDVNRSGRL